MRAYRIFLAKLRALFAQQKATREFEEEMQEHLQLLTERFLRQGMSPQDAVSAARRQFGNAPLLEQRQHEARTFSGVFTLWRDLCFGARILRRNPGSTAGVVVALALGIGMTTCVFTFINALMLRPPADVKDPGRLRELWLHHLGASGMSGYQTLNYPDYTYYRDHSRSFAGMMAFDGDPESVIWNHAASGQVLQAQLVSGNFFSVLGVAPALGRTFTSDDDRIDNPQSLVILSHAFWQQRLGSDPLIIGKTLMLNGANYLIVGVAPAGFNGLLAGIQPDLWAPLATIPWIAHDPDRFTNRQSYWLLVAARLAPGTKAQTAEAEISVLARQIEKDHPDTNKDLTADIFPATLVPGPYRGYVSAFSGLLLAAFVLVLLIACTNAASLLLMRATYRAREMAVRTAMGASRGRLVRQLLAESILLSSIAGAAGIALAWWIGHLLLALKPASMPITLALPIDWRVLLFALLVSLLTGIGFGIIPALRSARVEAVPVLKEETQAGSRRKSRLRVVLMTGQMAICVVLLIAATLCVRSLFNANSINPGFDTHHEAVATLDPEALGYSTAQVDAFYQELIEHIRALPGVTSASYTDHLPLGMALDTTSVSEADRAASKQNQIHADVFQVAPDYFRTLGVTLLRGRDFSKNDAKPSTPVVVINEALARRLWPGRDPVGRHIMLRGQNVEIIGVVGTGKYRTLGEEAIPVVFGTQLPSRRVLILRTAGDPTPLLDAIRREVQRVDPNMAATDLETIQQYMSFPLFPARTTGLLLGGAGILALVLTSIGLFGVISYGVSQRTHEIGIRMAMGARPKDVLHLVLREGLLITISGLVVGLAAAIAATRLLSSLLYGIRPGDPATLLGVSAGLSAVALLACYLPAQRAMRINPIAALRYE
jgi:predicted permease